jgi:hypothetical protein
VGNGGIEELGLVPAGAGSGLIPTPDLSLAAAAAAAEAYFRVSPGARFGMGAGFIPGSLDTGMGGGIVLRVARAGRGDFS